MAVVWCCWRLGGQGVRASCQNAGAPGGHARAAQGRAAQRRPAAHQAASAERARTPPARVLRPRRPCARALLSPEADAQRTGRGSPGTRPSRAWQSTRCRSVATSRLHSRRPAMRAARVYRSAVPPAPPAAAAVAASPARLAAAPARARAPGRRPWPGSVVLAAGSAPGSGERGRLPGSAAYTSRSPGSRTARRPA